MRISNNLKLLQVIDSLLLLVLLAILVVLLVFNFLGLGDSVTQVTQTSERLLAQLLNSPNLTTSDAAKMATLILHDNQAVLAQLGILKHELLGGLGGIFLWLLTSRLYLNHRFQHITQAAHEAQAIAEEALKTKARFLATMSHEIRTPMNGVIGMTRLLMNTPMSKKQTEFVESIHLSGEHLLTVINDVLDFSKLEAGKLDLKYEPIDLRSCIEDVLSLLSAKALEKNLELGYVVDTTIPLFIKGDLVRLRQILTNIIGNAIKFTQKGEVAVWVGIKTQTPTHYELEFKISDTGPGIPEHQRETIFEQFNRLDNTLIKSSEGTGLGLAISRRLIEMMNGLIWVESELGKGSCFHFTFTTQSSGGELRSCAYTNIPQIKGKRILLVENNQTSYRMLQDYCSNWGAITEAASGTDEAKNWISSGRNYDIALIESNLPENTTLDLAAFIRLHYNKQKLPLILIAPPNDKHDKNKVRELFNLYLTKPITRSRLFDSLMTILGEINFTIPQTTIENTKLGEQIKLSILLVEDNPINQIVAASILNEMAYTVDLAENGQKAIEAAHKKHYDLIFMDMQMPILDGLEATRRIRRELPKAEQPIIIAMTANALEGDKQICLEAGMNDYISKPVLPETVQQKLKQWFISSTLPTADNHYEYTCA